MDSQKRVRSRPDRKKKTEHVRPQLESLEDRRMLSATASAQADSAFIRYNNGQLWEHTASGFRFIDTNTASVSAGLDSTGGAAAFIVKNNGQLEEYSDQTGYRLIDGNVVRASASQVQRDTVFIVYVTGDVYEHTGTVYRAGFERIDANGINVSAGMDSLGQASVYITYNNNMVYEFSNNIGFHFIDSNASTVSASQTQNDTVFIIYLNSYLYEHVGTAHAAGFRFIDVNAIDVNTGKDSSGGPAAYILYNNHFVYEWSLSVGFHFIDVNAMAIGASQQQANTLFIVYNTEALYQHTGTSGYGFTFVDSNVETT